MPDGQPVVVKVRAPAHVRRARWASFWLVIFMLAVAVSPFLPFSIDPTGYITAHTNRWMFLVLFIYLAIEFDETARRSSTNMGGFISDNGLALVAIAIAFASLIVWLAHPTYRLTLDQMHIMLQCAAAAAFDFYYGVVISQRIAFAGKEREEEVARR